MKVKSLLLLSMLTAQQLFAQSAFNNYPVYTGTDLGLTYTPTHSIFKIWSPTALAAELLLYTNDEEANAYITITLKKQANGIWYTKQLKNLKEKFYAFRVNINGQWSNAVPDPYAKAANTNGKRAMVIDLHTTNPIGWNKDKSPLFSINNIATDAIIYELHIRDASIHPNSGIKNKGKFLGLVETGTKNENGLSTGLDHLKQLGVTHVHLLPFFDYNSVDESKPEKIQYNWGYDPVNYNIPEGSYSTNPANGAVRIKELKQMIAAFHKSGLSVVMDVVYNHVADAAASNFNQLVPGYYFRQNKNGGFSNATACGNETASERPMMRKFMLESLLYWVNEYHIDGFRFDLMGVHDIETMNIISAALHKIKPNILLYGEGWTAGESPLPEALRAVKKNAAKLNGIAVFSDDIRDAIKGSVFDINDRGFVSNKPGMEPSIKFGIVAASNHPQVAMDKVNYSKDGYAKAPDNVITYCECHDNNVLWDKLKLSCTNATKDELIKMHQLALTIVLTSQGTTFLHAGTEFLRTKNGIENSYNAGDSINQIDWHLKTVNNTVFKYVANLIKIRKAHPAFRLTSNDLIKKCIVFDEQAPQGTIAYSLNGAAVNDSWAIIYIAFNGSNKAQKMQLPMGNWINALDETNMGIHQFITVEAFGSIILFQEKSH
jgi:pullulanase